MSTATLDAIDRARRLLGLSYRSIAQALHVDESSLHRWRRGASAPAPVYVARLQALGDLLDALERVFEPAERRDGALPDETEPDEAPDEDEEDGLVSLPARRWLDTPLEPLRGRRPRDLFVAGDLTLLAAVLGGAAERAPMPPATPAPHGLDRRGRLAYGPTEEARSPFEQSFELAPVGLAHAALDGTMLRANRRFCDFVGYTAEELRGRRFHDITHPDDLARDLDQVLRLITGTAREYSIEKRYVRKDGRVVWAALAVHLVRDASGVPAFLIGTVEDITERKEGEAVRAAERRLAYALEGANDGLWDWNIEAGTLFVSPRGYAMLGLEPPREDPTVAEWFAGIHPDDLARVQAALDEHVAGKSPLYQHEFRVRRADATWMWVLARGRVLERDGDGRPLRMVGTFTDISARKATEQALAESEGRYRDLFERHGAVQLLLDADTRRLVDANPAACAFYGLTLPELRGKPIDELLVGFDEAEEGRRFAAGLGERLRMRLRHRAAGGAARDVEVTAMLVEAGGRRVFHSIIHDVTAEVEAQRALAANESRVAHALAVSDDGFFDFDLRTGTVHYSERWAVMLGLDRATLAATAATWRALMHPDDIADNDAAFARLVAGEMPLYDREVRYRHADGGWRWIRCRARIVERAADGAPLRILGTHTDVTAQREATAERERLLAAEAEARRDAERALDRAERLEAIARALSAATTPGEVADAILAQAPPALGARLGTVVLAVPDEPGVLALAGTVGFDAARLPRWRRFSDDTPLTEAVRTGEVVWIESAAELEARYPSLASEPRAPDTCQWLAVPFVTGTGAERRVPGGIGLAFTRRRVLSVSDRAFVLALGQQCAQALERARLYVEAQAARGQDRARTPSM